VKVSLQTLREATTVTDSIQALLDRLGVLSDVGDAMPDIVVVKKDGTSVKLRDAPKRGDYWAARAGTGEEAPYWHLSVPGRAKPLRVANAATLGGRLGFASLRPAESSFSSRPMTMEDARAEHAAGHSQTRQQHIASCTPSSQSLEIPAGWTLLAGHVLDWLKLRGAILTRKGLRSVVAQIYHLLEYGISYTLKRMEGASYRDCKNMRTNWLQQLEAARDGRFYMKRCSRGAGELCLGWGCWQVTFCAFSAGHRSNSSGENKLLSLICEDREVPALKEAVAADKHDAYFKLVVPAGAAPDGELIASMRIIQAEKKGDHAVSNGIKLPRLCSASATGQDWRFLHQQYMTPAKQWRVSSEDDLKGAVMPTVSAFYSAARALPRGEYYLPEMDTSFDEVTDDLIASVRAWVDFPWATAISAAERERFVAQWKGKPKKTNKRKRKRKEAPETDAAIAIATA
jgi:hypothetical protein